MVAGAPGFATRRGEVWGAARRLERRPRAPGRAAARGCRDARRCHRRRRAAATGRGAARPGRDLRRRRTCSSSGPATGWTGSPTRLHQHLRARPSHPRRPRPVVLNTWEAVLLRPRPGPAAGARRRRPPRSASSGSSSTTAGSGGRRDDTAGLGDWYVDEDVWPDGLHPIVDHVRGLGMQFGLWVEPEMVNLDSDLIRAHPDWLLDVVRPPTAACPVGAAVAPPARPRRRPARGLGVPAGAARRAGHGVRARLPQVGPQPRPARSAHLDRTAGDGGCRACTRRRGAVYAAAGRAAPPPSGPGDRVVLPAAAARVDLGILARTDRVWASDTNDALERQPIQRWTAQPAAARAGRLARRAGRARTPPDASLDLSFRLATSLFGHAGHRVGHHDVLRRRSWTGSGPGPRSTAGCARCCTPAPWSAPTPPTRGRVLHGVVAAGPARGGLLLRPDRHVAVRAAGPDAAPGPGPGAQLPAGALPGGLRRHRGRRPAGLARR